MYTPGYRPTTIATIDGLIAHRNNASGIFIHRCQNIVVTNGLFADNNIGVDIDRAAGIVVSDTVIIGESESYRQLMARQTVEPVCRRHEKVIVGLDLDTWKVDEEFAGAKIINVDFSGFSNVTCRDSASIRFDDLVSWKGFCPKLSPNNN
jgi:hypothetical protein